MDTNETTIINLTNLTLSYFQLYFLLHLYQQQIHTTMPAIGQFQLNQLRDAIDLSNNAIQQSTNAIQHQNAATAGLRSLL